MIANENMPNLEALDRSLKAGDISAAREILFQLSDDEQRRLKIELGEQAFKQLYASARKIRRGRKQGRVILLHGIMGSTLDVVKKGDADRVWINYWRLFNGRVSDLKLTLAGDPVPAGTQIRVVGQNRKAYLPMLMELDQQWHVKPFSYDWREDIAKSAERLAAEVKTFGNGQPVHLVGHSMGGLVSRTFIQLFPDLWQSMRDPQGCSEGGRLIMLGTPNHGSYAIPLAMSGGEKLVKMLGVVDRKHDLKELLDILNTFLGSYQMLPSPLIELNDNHRELYERKNWGSLPVHQLLLDRAAELHRTIGSVIDPERFLYVAGYNRPTPYRIRIDRPGVFSYQLTHDGDGRVPHELGLLNGVNTYWVDEDHGSLASNADVMDAIHGLLIEGVTDVLVPTRPSVRALPQVEWKSTEELEPLTQEFSDTLKTETSRRSAKESKIDWERQIRIENLLLSDYVGEARGGTVEPISAKKETKASPGYPQKLTIEVVWGDITKVKGDVYCVGHYQDVLPQYAEKALDEAMSETEDPERQILRQHTLRGILRGALGDIGFYPWQSVDGIFRTVAVAGMGRPGSFGKESLRMLVHKLTWAVASLPQVKTVCTVLIGSGEGTLEPREAVDGLIKGLTDALASESLKPGIEKVKIVELYRGRAEEIHRRIEETLQQPWSQEYINLELKSEPTRGADSRISDKDVLELLLDEVIKLSSAKLNTKDGRALATLIEKVQVKNTKAEELRKALKRVPSNRKGQRACVSFIPDRGADFQAAQPQQEIPTRISFFRDGENIRVAAISETATVSERILKFDPSLISEIVEDINALRETSVGDVPDFLTRLLLPRKFRDLLTRDVPLVFEVDRWMAQVHWEMLAHSLDSSDHKKPIGIQTKVARQLRTTYSPPPIRSRKPSEKLKALVIGDPGDPKRGMNLPGATKEALEIYDVLKSHGVEVDIRIGAPSAPRRGRLQDIKPATRIEALHLLMQGGYDILHYAGHADFDPKDPVRAGWLFSEGLLTARELERIDEAPCLVVANACLSARSSQTLAGGANIVEQRSDEYLLPSLADEFFHRGVRNYIGTAWEVNDIGAVLFAKTFYESLFKGNSYKIGEAVQKARLALYEEQRFYGRLWAAYQHYGDPVSPLRLPELRD